MDVCFCFNIACQIYSQPTHQMISNANSIKSADFPWMVFSAEHLLKILFQ